MLLQPGDGDSHTHDLADTRRQVSGDFFKLIKKLDLTFLMSLSVVLFKPDRFTLKELRIFRDVAVKQQICKNSNPLIFQKRSVMVDYRN